MNDYRKLNLLVQVSRLYYEHDMGQREIADILKISRSYVSKLLIEAKELKIVEIKINDTIETENEMEAFIREKFGLKKVIIVPSDGGEPDKQLEGIGIALARYLYNIVSDKDIIGVSWGVTLHTCAQRLMKKYVKDVKVTQLYGGMMSTDKGVHINEIITNFAKAFDATPYFLLLPSIVDSYEMKAAIIKDKNVANVLEMAQNCQIAVYSVGEFGLDSSLVRAGFFTSNEVEELLKKGVVGDACARLYNIKGEIVESEFDKRTIGLQLNELRHKKYSILVAGGQKKVKSIYGALCGGYANVLITDEMTARSFLSTSDS